MFQRSSPSTTPRLGTPSERRRLWVAYAAVCALVWFLHVLAGTEFQRGLWQVWESVYQATVSLWAAMLLGPLVQPWVCWLQRRELSLLRQLTLHALAALLFGAAWQACDFILAYALFGEEHASAMLAQDVLWRLIWGVFVYVSLSTGFAAWMNAQRARASAVAAAQAESALARAELAAISGKLNPHFLFNTLNSLIALTRKDARAAEQGLLRFSSMLRYVLDTKRSANDRVALAEELDFVRDYLALESLRLGQRLRVEWDLDERTLEDEIPPLSLQPLVENSIIHAIAPRPQGGQLQISARRDALSDALQLCVADDGPGCEPAMLEESRPGRRGIGLSALRQRFSLDYEGRARLRIHTAPGQGFRVDLWIPQHA